MRSISCIGSLSKRRSKMLLLPFRGFVAFRVVPFSRGKYENMLFFFRHSWRHPHGDYIITSPGSHRNFLLTFSLSQKLLISTSGDKKSCENDFPVFRCQIDISSTPTCAVPAWHNMARPGGNFGSTTWRFQNLCVSTRNGKL